MTLILGAAIATIWFFVVNFLADEMRHPLDYFSNKLRLRPHIFFLVAALLAACGVVPMTMGVYTELLENLPQLAAVVYGLGLAVFGKVWSHESTAAGLLALLLYAPVSFATTLIVMSPTLTGNWAGWVYSNMYLAAQLFWVVWLRAAANRRQPPDKSGARKPGCCRRLCCCFSCCCAAKDEDDPDAPLEPTSLLPEGSERLMQMWERAVYFAAPLLIAVSNLVNLMTYLLEEGMYGWACAVGYWAGSCAMLAGCCYEFRSGTELA